MADASSNPNPIHTILILIIVGTVLVVPWLLPEASEGPAMTLPPIQQMPILIMLAPILLLVLVRFLASEKAAGLTLGNADASTIHRVSGSSIGLSLVLILVIGLIAFQSMMQGAVATSQ